ncbi:MAG: apolipoprotein N-acyltransferase [Pseudomonadota bacterium]
MKRPRRLSWLGAAAVVGLGAVMALGLEPFGLWPLTLVALAGVIAIAVRVQAGWVGWLAGAGYFGLGLCWIVDPFLVDAAAYGWMAPFALVFMACGLALFWGLGFWLGAKLPNRAMGLVAGLSLAEFARGYVLTGFPWALVSHIWVETPLAQVDALVGPFGLALLTTLIAAMACRFKLRGLLGGAVLLGLGWAYGLYALSQPDPVAPAVTLRLVQPNAAQQAKWDPVQAQAIFDRLMAATSAPPGPLGKVDLVVWPETALPYLVEDQPDLPAQITAAAHGAAVAVGLQRIAPSAEGTRGWNSLKVYGPAGQELAAYDKHHLVPFGEYIPMGDLAYEWFGLRAFAAQTGAAYTAGPGARVLDLGGKLGKVLPLICYEAVFAQDLRVPERADWILQITNDAWFGTVSGPFQHAAQARLRAIEQGLPLVRVANTGLTEVIDARGRITAKLPFGTSGFLDATLPAALSAPPYARWGEIPGLLLLVGCFLWALRKPRTAWA